MHFGTKGYLKNNNNYTAKQVRPKINKKKEIKKGIILYWLISESTLNIEKEGNQRKKKSMKVSKKEGFGLHII